MKLYAISEVPVAVLWIVFFLSAVLVVLALVIISGKGDQLIAGYNTASEKEKAGYNMRRLRFIIGMLLFGGAFYVLLIPFLQIMQELVAMSAFILFALIGVVLANTWAKK